MRTLERRIAELEILTPRGEIFQTVPPGYFGPFPKGVTPRLGGIGVPRREDFGLKPEDELTPEITEFILRALKRQREEDAHEQN